MPKIVDHEQMRCGFIEASLAVIASEGLEAVTLRRVAADAGFTTGAIAHYFTSRHELLIGALRNAHESAAIRMRRVASAAPAPKERLIAVIRESLPLDTVRQREWRVWLGFWAAAAADPVLSEENHARYAEWRSALERLCRDAFPQHSNANMLAMQLLAVIDGLGLQIAVHGNRRPKQLRKMVLEAEALIEAIIALAQHG
jgi:AcrR family transcriptional regulator